MTIKHFKFLAVLASFAFIFVVQQAHAQETSTSTVTITYPVAELGNCASAKACKSYCNQLDPVEACITFAKEHGLISTDDAATSLKLKDIKIGPGGCTTKDNCKTYCSDTAHTDECAKFAQDHKILNSDDLQRYRRFQAAIKDRRAPGSCHDQHTCETFCQERSHNDECLKFAKDNALLDEDKSSAIEKFEAAIKAGTTPGGCDSKDACETYCSAEEHRTECLEFAKQLGIIKGETVEKLKKTGFMGPGGCKTRDACETFCNDPTNQQTCLEFAKSHDILDSDEVDRIKDATKSMRDVARGIRQQVMDCLKKRTDSDTSEKIEEGSFTPDAETAQAMKDCIRAIQRPSSLNSQQSTLPPQLTAIQKECLLKVLGADASQKILAGTASLTPEIKEKLSACMLEAQSRLRETEE